MPVGWVEQREQRGIQFLGTERGVGSKKVCMLVGRGEHCLRVEVL